MKCSKNSIKAIRHELCTITTLLLSKNKISCCSKFLISMSIFLEYVYLYEHKFKLFFERVILFCSDKKENYNMYSVLKMCYY